MTDMTASADKTPARIEPRNVIARRFLTRTLHRAAAYSDVPFAAGLLILLVLRYVHAGPAWIAQATEWQLIGYSLIAYGLNRLFDHVAEGIADAFDPDRFDGDMLFEMSASLRDLRSDVESGADTDDVLDSLVASRVIEELSITVRGISQQFAARGDEDEVQRLMAVVLHLRNADTNLGYGTLNAALDAVGHRRDELS